MLDADRIDARLAAALPPGALFAVGGRVRDEVRSSLDGLERPAKDLDYVVAGVELAELVRRLESVGTADVVGASFAVIKATLDGVTVDVALPRRERSTGRGHRDFEVEAGPGIPLADDLGRRDFRMNMLARGVPSGALVDPYGGEADIRAKRIDLLKPAAFVEDPLRMLRACGFAARLDFAVTPATMDAMRAAAPLVATVSPERVRDEVIKFVAGSARPSLGIDLMREGGLLAFVFPEIAEGIGVEQNVFHAYDVYRHNLVTMDAASQDDLVLRLAALLHDVGKPRTREASPEGTHFYGHENVGAEMTEELLERLRFPHDVVSNVAGLVKRHMYVADAQAEPKTLRRFVRRVGLESLARQFALRAADIVGSGLPKRDGANEAFERRVYEIVQERPPLAVRDLAVNGHDVLAALVAAGRLNPGSKGGREVGAVLRRLLDAVVDEPSRNDRGRLLLEADRLVAGDAAESIAIDAPAGGS